MSDDAPLVQAEPFDFQAFWSDPENHARGRVAVDKAVEDAVECFESRRGIVDFAGHHLPTDQAHAEVRMIARWGASLALGLQRRPESGAVR